MASPISPKIPAEVPGTNYLQNVPSDVKAKILAMSGLRSLTGAMVLDKLWQKVAQQPNIWTRVAKELGISLTNTERVDTKNPKLDASKNEELYKRKVNEFLILRAENDSALKFIPDEIAKKLRAETSDPYILRSKIGQFYLEDWYRNPYLGRQKMLSRNIGSGESYTDHELGNLTYFGALLDRCGRIENIIEISSATRFIDTMLGEVESGLKKEDAKPDPDRYSTLMAVQGHLCEYLSSKAEEIYGLKASNADDFLRVILSRAFVRPSCVVKILHRLKEDPYFIVRIIKLIYVYSDEFFRKDIRGILDKEFETGWIKGVANNIYYELKQFFLTAPMKLSYEIDLSGDKKAREEELKTPSKREPGFKEKMEASLLDQSAAQTHSRTVASGIYKEVDAKLKESNYALEDSSKLVDLSNALSKALSNVNSERVKLEKKLYKDKKFSDDQGLMRFILQLDPKLHDEILSDKHASMSLISKWRSGERVKTGVKTMLEPFERIGTLAKYQKYFRLAFEVEKSKELVEINNYIISEIKLLKQGLVAKIEVQLAVTLENVSHSTDQKTFQVFHTKAIHLLKERDKMIEKLKKISSVNDVEIANWEKQSAGIKKQIDSLTFKEVKSSANSPKEEAAIPQPIASSMTAAGLPPPSSGGPHAKEMDSKHKHEGKKTDK